MADKTRGNAMRRTIAIVLATMLASSIAMAQSDTNSGASAWQTRQQVRSGDDEVGGGFIKSERHESRSKQCKGHAWKQIRPSSQASVAEVIRTYLKIV
jgi:hypothetical protein